MTSGSKKQDLPEPWSAPKKTKSMASTGKSVFNESRTVDDLCAQTSVHKPTKRGRGRPKGKPKMADSTKGKRTAKSLSASMADVILGRTKSPVADVEELRRKREEDAVACGRQVRSVQKMPNAETGPTSLAIDTIDADCVDEVTPDTASPLRLSPLKSSTIPPSTEYRKQVEVDATVLLEERENRYDACIVQYPVKHSSAQEWHQSAEAPRNVDSNVPRQRQNFEADRGVNCERRFGEVLIPHLQRQSPPPFPRRNDQLERREIGRTYSVDYATRHIKRPTGYDGSTSKSPQRSSSRINRTPEYRRWGRSVSMSPERWREGHQQSVHKLAEFYEDYVRKDHNVSEHGTYSSFSNKESGRYRDSASLEMDVRCRRSHSPHENRRVHRRMSPPEWSRSPPRRLPDSGVGGKPNWTSLTSVKQEEIMGTYRALSALGRRERRHDESLREENMSTRQKDGKKPFYLTLDPEGKPYGPGKPAWVAQINKLAAGLDPSCTHIRKQTFVAIQTLKDRLDEDFDYSGTLNEDHLRGLMGKAVTKRRGELISIIKSGGEQPYNIDHRIWRRLEKLAYSKQREEKSEQGRYANSCRKTLGRTGAKGVSGVREKLRSTLGRSPDPDEVEEEMQRDKGFGGQKRKRQIQSRRGEENGDNISLSEEDSLSQSGEKCADELSSDSGGRQPFQRLQSEVQNRPCQKRNGRGKDYGAGDMLTDSERTSVRQRSADGIESHSPSKDDLIETLKAEIHRLQSEISKAPIADQEMPSQSTPYIREGRKLRHMEAGMGGRVGDVAK